MSGIIGTDVVTQQNPVFTDTHRVPTTANAQVDQRTGFLAPYDPDFVSAEQWYWFRDPVLNEETAHFYGPMRLEKEVLEDTPGLWKYIFRKFEPDRPGIPFATDLILP